MGQSRLHPPQDADYRNSLSTGTIGIHYSPLVAGDSIRLCRLQPGAGNDPICIELVESRLNDEPSYEALSYVWSDPSVMSDDDPPPKVYCNQKEVEATPRFGQNNATSEAIQFFENNLGRRYLYRPTK